MHHGWGGLTQQQRQCMQMLVGNVDDIIASSAGELMLLERHCWNAAYKDGGGACMVHQV